MFDRIFIALVAATAFFATSAGLHSNDEGAGAALSGDIDAISYSAIRSAVRQVLTTQGKPYTGFSNATTPGKEPVLDFTGSFRVGSSCWDIQTNQGASRSGIYFVQPPSLSQGPWRVLCDLETDGGNWTVFQVRDNVEPQENFNRNWDDYKVGFGDFDREFWLGNVLLHALTNAGVDNELAIELEDWSGNKRFARYLSFRLGNEVDKYRLYHQNLYFGNAGDSLSSHNGLPFSTFDVDNDNRDGDYAERSCARLYRGGWWYGNCHDSNLNGLYLGGAHRSFADGVNWYTWTGYNYSLRKTVMRFRPMVGGAARPVVDDAFLAAIKKTALKNKP